MEQCQLDTRTVITSSLRNIEFSPSLLMHWTCGICVPGPHSFSLSGTQASSLTTSQSKQLGSSHGMASTRWGQFPVPPVGSLMIFLLLILKPVTGLTGVINSVDTTNVSCADEIWQHCQAEACWIWFDLKKVWGSRMVTGDQRWQFRQVIVQLVSLISFKKLDGFDGSTGKDLVTFLHLCRRSFRSFSPFETSVGKIWQTDHMRPIKLILEEVILIVSMSSTSCISCTFPLFSEVNSIKSWKPW